MLGQKRQKVAKSPRSRSPNASGERPATTVLCAIVSHEPLTSLWDRELIEGSVVLAALNNKPGRSLERDELSLRTAAALPTSRAILLLGIAGTSAISLLYPPTGVDSTPTLCGSPFLRKVSDVSLFAQRGNLGNEGPLLGPEPDDDSPDSSLDDLSDPELCVPDLLPGPVGRPFRSRPLGLSTPGQGHTPSPTARGVREPGHRT